MAPLLRTLRRPTNQRLEMVSEAQAALMVRIGFSRGEAEPGQL